MDSDDKIPCSRFYFEWKGHQIRDVDKFRSIAQSQRPDKPLIYLAGDSSLDNKYWVPSSGPFDEALPVPVPEIYTDTLEPVRPKPDVAFWLNHFLQDQATAVNLAVEASTLGERSERLLEHDEYIRDHIRAEDTLVVSVGANDIALKPTFATICSMLALAWLTPRSSLERGTAWSLAHFTRLFKTDVEVYIDKLVCKTKPRMVVVCMIYFPLESATQSSWADIPLKALGYNLFPGRLQAAIRGMYEKATKQVSVEGVQRIVPCKLFEVLDGKREEDYTDRVEPSREGGRKMAGLLLRLLGGDI